MLQSRYESTSTLGPVRLIADAGNPAIEVFVINGYFDRVAKGVGRVDTQQPPGLYKVKFVAGSSAREVHVALEPGSGLVQVGPPDDLLFSTPAPMEKTSTTHEYHEYSAEQLSRRIHHMMGAGSQLFVFARDLRRRDLGDVPSDLILGDDDPAADLTLHDLAGHLLIDFKLVGEREIYDAVRDPWAGCNIELDPGSYRLRVRTHTIGTLEQIVVTSAGWQTQIFLLQRSYGYQSSVRRADLGNASIMMAPLGSGFQASDAELRQVELVRQGLANGRVVINADVLRWMFASKFVSPMLGIYGAHLLLSQEPDHELLHTVVDNLHALLGPHPDVTALDVWLGLPERTPAPVYQAPPMLRSSWRILVHASVAHPEIVPIGSFAAQIADRVWGDSAWLVWQEPSEQGATLAPVDLSELQGVLPQIADLLSKTSSNEPAVEMAQVMNLTTLEYMLLEYIARAAPLKVREVPEVQQILQTEQHSSIQQLPKTREVPEVQRPWEREARQRELDKRTLQEQQQMWFDVLKTFTPWPGLRRWGREHLTDVELVQALGFPTAAIHEAAAGLIEKLASPGTSLPSS